MAEMNMAVFWTVFWVAGLIWLSLVAWVVHGEYHADIELERRRRKRERTYKCKR